MISIPIAGVFFRSAPVAPYKKDGLRPRHHYPHKTEALRWKEFNEMQRRFGRILELRVKLGIYDYRNWRKH